MLYFGGGFEYTMELVNAAAVLEVNESDQSSLEDAVSAWRTEHNFHAQQEPPEATLSVDRQGIDIVVV